MNETVTIIVIFMGLQLINVMLNTGKTLIMSRTDSPRAAAIINAVTFAFYVAVVKQIATLDLAVTISVTVVTNVIGVYITYWIMKKIRKDNLWKIEIYIAHNLKLGEGLRNTGIPYTETAPQVITMYAYTQEDSDKVKKVLKENPVAKYNITEITKRF